jgi:hypothetical protein
MKQLEDKNHSWRKGKSGSKQLEFNTLFSDPMRS